MVPDDISRKRVAYKIPRAKTPMRATFFLAFICSLTRTGIGMAKMRISFKHETTPLVKPTVIRGFGTQVPPLIVLSQKKLTGWHSRSEASQAPQAQKTVKPKMIHPARRNFLEGNKRT